MNGSVTHVKDLMQKCALNNGYKSRKNLKEKM